MKDEVTYDKCKNPKKNAIRCIFFCENMIFKILFQYPLAKVSTGFEVMMCGSPTQCLRPLSYGDTRPIAIEQNI